MADKKPQKSGLLPADALTGVRLGISVSESLDLARLGLTESHFRIAIGEIARCVLASNGQLTYGGHLDPEGYTAFLMGELERYHRGDRPFHICLAWPVHRRYSLDYLREQRESLKSKGDITYLDVEGIPTDDPAAGRTEEPVPKPDPATQKQGLTSLRRYMAKNTEGRIFIGGKRTGFTGDWPGLVEEAIFALETDQPIYLAGGYGGVTLDMVRALGIDDCNWFPGFSDEVAQDPRCSDGLERLARIREERGGKLPDNGLDDSENRQLAATHRPSEIAALISLGLGKLFAGKQMEANVRFFRTLAKSRRPQGEIKGSFGTRR
uniref:Uncharacterized protein n=1 Tax=Candidatus Kentrum sp. FM TaxID=2126340 RepID=A0A450SIT8_9GAMM|nr:MAG: hypothetical protein BECKFM1743A_GA0114220_101094 [Candidatus Kentron sp. FM]VFJ53301.1 MAG: hypothetical protein BECKFM1743C_GA0114222_101224 [Candidatus Kentron sp. FM]VFK09787.1 MAG: hypothetical protein BECKFM1743B_GA0114221_101154 [Candidatus Kentron sp. FM]